MLINSNYGYDCVFQPFFIFPEASIKSSNFQSMYVQTQHYNEIIQVVAVNMKMADLSIAVPSLIK